MNFHNEMFNALHNSYIMKNKMQYEYHYYKHKIQC